MESNCARGRRPWAFLFDREKVMKSHKSFSRTDRVEQQVLEILSRMLITDLKDPRVENAQLTAVEVSPDLKYAKVYWVPLRQDADRDRVQLGLEKAGGFMRRQLGEALETKFTPELTFLYDDALERGRRMDELLDELEIPAASEDED